MNEMRKQDNAAPTGLAAFYEVTDDQYSMYYTHRDHLGSIKCITNESGVVIEKMNFDPWGNWRNPTDWSETSVPSPVKLARFLSPDILVQDKTYTQSFNRYTYTANNPLKYTDPSGYKLRGFQTLVERDGRYDDIGPVIYGDNNYYVTIE